MADLFSLAKNNKFEELRVMFNKGIGVKAADEQGRTLLHHAAAANAAEVIDLLLERGASWNVVDKQGYTPVAAASKLKLDDAVITCVERGADPSTILPDTSTLTGNAMHATFPTRLAAARQICAARNAAKSSSLLLGIMGPSTPQSAGPTSLTGSQVTNNDSLRFNPSSSSPAVVSAVEDPRTKLVNSTIRRSSISIRSTAEKDSVLSQPAPAPKPAAPPTSPDTTSNRRASVQYATIRPRTATLSTVEGVSLRAEVAAQMGAHSVAPLAPLSSSASSSNVSPSPPPAASSSSPPLSSSSPSAEPEKSEKDKKSKDKKDKDKKNKEKESEKEKKDKKDKKDKEDKKEKEKEKKSKEKDHPDTPTPSRRETKKEFRRKQAEDEAAKQEARAEKTKKRRTLNIFGSSKSSSKPESAAPKKAAEPAPSSSAAPSTPPVVESAPAPTAKPTPTLNSAAVATASTSALASPPTSPNTHRRMLSAAEQEHVRATDGQATLVDEIPDGAVELPNGDFLVGIEADAVNLDALTDAMAKVMTESFSPLLGTPNFDMKPLLEATRVLSTSIKNILAISDVYALTLDDPAAADQFKEITNSLKTEIARGLVMAIKALTVNNQDVNPLRQAMKSLATHVSGLYKCLETVSPPTVVEMLQGVVLSLRSLVSSAKVDSPEKFQVTASQAVIISMRLSSLVQDFSFVACKSLRNTRALMECVFAFAQSVRGLVMAASAVSNDPRSEQNTATMAQLLKTAAEQVRSISRVIREEETFAANLALARDNDRMLEPASIDGVIQCLRKGCGLMANAKDKYVSRTDKALLANDEKQILAVVLNQAQLVASLLEGIGQGDGCILMTAASSAGQSMTRLHKLVQPLLDTCPNGSLTDEAVVCLENIIRCGIQVKIMCSLISTNPTSSEYKLQLGYLAQLWGCYISLLLDAVWRTEHTLL